MSYVELAGRETVVWIGSVMMLAICHCRKSAAVMFPERSGGLPHHHRCRRRRLPVVGS